MDDVEKPRYPQYVAMRGGESHVVKTSAYVLTGADGNAFVYLRTEEVKVTDAEELDFTLLHERSARLQKRGVALRASPRWSLFREIIRLAEHDCAESGPRDLG